MNAKMITGLSALLILTAGCVATPSTPPASQDVTTLTKAQRYQAVVNQQARRNGAEVHWVNLPDEGDLAHYADPDSKETSSASN